jgi:hypothetical protein
LKEVFLKFGTTITNVVFSFCPGALVKLKVCRRALKNRNSSFSARLEPKNKK